MIEGLPADRVHRGAGCIAWRTRHPMIAGHAGAICVNGPVVSADAVIVANATPNVVWAATKTTGDLMWSRRCEDLGAVRVAADPERLYVYSGSAIICLDPSTGALKWDTRDWIRVGPASDALQLVRAPSVYEGQLFWPSMGGLVTSADASTGSLLWSTRLPRQMVSSVVVAGDKVIGVDQNASAFALGRTDGRLVWTRELPDRTPRCIGAGWGGVLIALEDGIVLVDITSGIVVNSWTWAGQITGDVVGGPEAAFVVRAEPVDSIVGGEHMVIAGLSQILRLGGGGTIGWTMETSPWGPHITWDERHGVILEACGGLGIIDPERGRRLHVILLEDEEIHLMPAVEGDQIFVSTVGGELLCLSTPVVGDSYR